MPAQAKPDPATAAPRPVLSGRDLRWVGLLTALTALVHSLIAISAYYRFVMGSFDVVIFDQVMRSYASLSAPVSIVKGVHDGFGPSFSVLGDHFSPANALLAPLY